MPSTHAASLRRTAPVIACVISGAFLSITAVAVSQSGGGPTLGGDDVDFLSGAEGAEAFWVILAKNVTVAALLYSGVVTGGLSTLIGIPAVGFAIGAFAGASAARHGWSALFEAVVAYAPIEFLALVVFGGAGLLPSLSAAIPLLEDGRGPLQRYLRALARTLPLAALGLGLLAVGAFVETTAISSR